jgi:hypothetical protein
VTGPRLLRLLLAGVGLAVVLLLGDARTAAADNCSGLSDCYFVSKSAVTVTVGIGTVAVVLLLTPPIGGSPDVKPLDPGDVPLKPKPGAKPPFDPTKQPVGEGFDPTKQPVDQRFDPTKQPVDQPFDPTVQPTAKPPPPADGVPAPQRFKVVEANGSVVEHPVKPPRPADEEAMIRVKVREAEQAVAKLPRLRQKLIFAEEANSAGHEQQFKTLGAAVGRAVSPEEWIRLVNPTGNQVNAAATVNAVDAALDKVPRIARSSGALTAAALATAHDSIVTYITDLDEVRQFLGKAGPGARGIVTVHWTVPASWANAAPVHIGHAFNAANVDGRLVYADAQTGALVATPHEILAATGHDPSTLTAILFVPTRPALSPH